jgi:hypothetical protein
MCSQHFMLVACPTTKRMIATYSGLQCHAQCSPPSARKQREALGQAVVISCKSDTLADQKPEPSRGQAYQARQGPTRSLFALNSNWPPLAVRSSESVLDVLAVLVVVVVVVVCVSCALTTRRTRAKCGLEAATGLTEAARRCIIAETGMVAGVKSC